MSLKIKKIFPINNTIKYIFLHFNFLFNFPLPAPFTQKSGKRGPECQVDKVINWSGYLTLSRSSESLLEPLSESNIIGLIHPTHIKDTAWILIAPKVEKFSLTKITQ